MIKGIIFDVDGVLLDSMSIWNDLGARYLRRHGLTPEDGLNAILFSMSMEQGADYLSVHYPLNKTSAEVAEGIQEMLRDFYYDEVLPKTGAPELMRFFAGQGLPMIAATSSPRTHVERALSRNGMLDYLQGMLTTTEEGTSKHTPEIYLKAASLLGTAPKETLVFEDSLYALKTASSAGFVTVGVFDADGEGNQAGLREAADLYVNAVSEVIPNWAVLNGK